MIVQGIIEQVNTTGSEYQYLTDAGIDVRSHTGVPNIMHHKYAIFDKTSTLTGSYNWTRSADHHNEENFLVYALTRDIQLFFLYH
mgnify:CR=1 FL=1